MGAQARTVSTVRAFLCALANKRESLEGPGGAQRLQSGCGDTPCKLSKQILVPGHRNHLARGCPDGLIPHYECVGPKLRQRQVLGNKSVMPAQLLRRLPSGCLQHSVVEKANLQSSQVVQPVARLVAAKPARPHLGVQLREHL
jgi:hypothetical protein